MSEHQLELIVGEIVAISEEIEEFATDGHNVNELTEELIELIAIVERHLTVHKIIAAPAATGTANTSQ